MRGKRDAWGVGWWRRGLPLGLGCWNLHSFELQIPIPPCLHHDAFIAGIQAMCPSSLLPDSDAGGGMRLEGFLYG